MLETTDQPDAAYRVSGGFGFDDRDISLEEQKEGDSHRLEGLWEPRRQGSCCLPGWDGPTVADPSRQQKTNFIITIVRRDKSSILYKLKQSPEVRTLEKRYTL